MEQTSGYVEVGGQKTRVVESGMGPPVVLLHGWGGRLESMGPVAECLRGRFRVVSLDLPGFGEAPVPRGVWGSADYATYVRDVVAAAGIEKAHLIGHSFGGKLALYLAATHQELVDKLVVVDASGVRRAPSLKVRGKRMASRGARAVGGLGAPGRRVRDVVYRHIASRDYEEAGPLRPILVKVVNEDLSHLLPRITASTLLVWGGDDTDTPPANARIMERLIPDAGLVTLDGAGHFSYLDAPERFCRIVRHFLGAPLS